jgi:hypothetical protein
MLTRRNLIIAGHIAGNRWLSADQSSGLLTAIVEPVKSWHLWAGSSVKLEIDCDALEVNGITRSDHCELIQAWIDRHADQ